MSGAHAALQRLTQGLRQHGPVLLAGVAQPYLNADENLEIVRHIKKDDSSNFDELLTLVWGPHFDRVHALGLAAGQPAHAAHLLPALVQAADCFDALHAPAQRRLRRMILRHRAHASAPHRPG